MRERGRTAPMTAPSPGRSSSEPSAYPARRQALITSPAPYPLARRAVLVYRKPAAPAVEQFLAFIGSPDGARIIRSNGAVPSR